MDDRQASNGPTAHSAQQGATGHASESAIGRSRACVLALEIILAPLGEDERLQPHDDLVGPGKRLIDTSRPDSHAGVFGPTQDTPVGELGLPA